MAAVGEGERPRERGLRPGRDGDAADGRVEAAAAELRLAERREVLVAPVAVEDGEGVAEDGERAGERVGPHERQVVAGGVVLGVLAVGRPREAPDGQVHARGAELALVVAVGRPRADRERLPGVAEGDGDGAVDGEGRGERPAARLLVREAAGIAEVGEDEAVADVGPAVSVAAQPRDRAEGAGREQDAERVAPPRACRALRGEDGRDGERARVVVGEGRVAGVRRDQDLVRGLARHDGLAVRERAVEEVGVDEHLGLAAFAEFGRRGVQVVVCEAEAPRRRVVRRPVRDEGGLLGERVQVRAQRGHRHPRPHGPAVLDEVQRARGPVRDAAARRQRDVRLADAPLGRDRPVEHGLAGRDLRRLDRHDFSQARERLAEPRAGQAPAQRQQVRDERVQARAGPGNRGHRRSRHGGSDEGHGPSIGRKGRVLNPFREPSLLGTPHVTARPPHRGRFATRRRRRAASGRCPAPVRPRPGTRPERARAVPRWTAAPGPPRESASGSACA